jgi:Zinc finger, C2H2 type
MTTDDEEEEKERSSRKKNVALPLTPRRTNHGWLWDRPAILTISLNKLADQLSATAKNTGEIEMPKKKKAMPKARPKGKSSKAVKKSKVTRSKTTKKTATRKTTTRKTTSRNATSPPALYKCEKCGATFTDPEMLEKHRQSHLTAATIASPQIVEGEEAGLQGQPRTPPSSPPPEPEPMSTSGPAP